jgi:hypothetical protein
MLALTQIAAPRPIGDPSNWRDWARERRRIATAALRIIAVLERGAQTPAEVPMADNIERPEKPRVIRDDFLWKHLHLISGGCLLAAIILGLALGAFFWVALS